MLWFRQKKGYEMRSCDWSADVCSSDLHALEDRHIGGQVRIIRLDAIMILLRLDLRCRVSDQADMGHHIDAGIHIIARCCRDNHGRSEERSVGKVCVSKCRSMWSPKIKITESITYIKNLLPISKN